MADTVRAVRVCDRATRRSTTSRARTSPTGCSSEASGSSWCEWKGAATYWDAVVDGRRVPAVGWSYEDPRRASSTCGARSGRVDRALVDGELVRPQAGGFYGGWITDEVVGPFKGDPGTGLVVPVTIERPLRNREGALGGGERGSARADQGMTTVSTSSA